MINYPTWKIRGNPTPNERLMICDVCGKAEWYTHGWPTVVYCDPTYNKVPNHGRMREATKEEYVEGKAALKTVI